MSGLRGLALAFLLVLSAPGYAQSPENAARYQEALKAIADSRLEQAITLLSQLIEYAPEHAGAWLDLALTLCQAGQQERAERMFQQIEERFPTPAAIRELIAYHRASGCKGPQIKGRLAMSLARGSESNVNQGASHTSLTIGSGPTAFDLQLAPDYLPKRDAYTEFGVEHARELTANGVRLFAKAQARKYDRLGAYDTAGVATGLEDAWQAAGWQLNAMGGLSWLQQGNSLYQRRAMLQLAATPPLRLPEHAFLSAIANLSHAAYPTLPQFDADLVELRASLAYRPSPLTSLQLYLGRVADHPLANRPGGSRRGWSAEVDGRMLLFDKYPAELGWFHQSLSSATGYLPGFIDGARRDDTRLWRLAVSYPLGTEQGLRLEWRSVRNDDPISIFNFRDRSLQLGWQWLRLW